MQILWLRDILNYTYQGVNEKRFVILIKLSTVNSIKEVFYAY